MNKTVKTNENNDSKKPKKPIITFWNKNQKGILIASGVIGTVVFTILGVKYYRDFTAFERWLKKAPLDELKTVRKNVHSEYMKHTVNDEYRDSLQKLLPILDKKISKIEWAGKTPTGPAYHREHGFSLYKSD